MKFLVVLYLAVTLVDGSYIQPLTDLLQSPGSNGSFVDLADAVWASGHPLAARSRMLVATSPNAERTLFERAATCNTGYGEYY